MENSIETVKKGKITILDAVSEKVHNYISCGAIAFPPDYSPDNALKSAWLIIQDTETTSHVPALVACTPSSVINAMLNTVIQGLNPAKQQCYYVPYGNKLVMQRSYFGTMHLAKRVCRDIKDIYAATVREGQQFEIELDKGRTVVKKHEVKFGDSDKPIIGAYCTIEFNDGTTDTTVMTIKEINEAWKQSKMKPIDENGNVKKGSTHARFSDEMAKKTVINRACKPIINSSSDSNLLIRSVRDADICMAEAEAAENIIEKENSIPIDFDTGEVLECIPEACEQSDVENSAPNKAAEPNF